MASVVVERDLTLTLTLTLLVGLSLAAPGLSGTRREEAAGSVVLSNPFGTAEENRRLLQSYIQSSLQDGGGPQITTWEQEVFFLFGLYDFDRSGLLDGLEMMKLLSDYTSHQAPGAQANEQVVSMVDFLLQTQDLNQDGLLAPSELLSRPLPHTQDSSDDRAPHREEEAEEKLSNREEEEEQPQHGETPEEEAVKDMDEQRELPEAPAAEGQQDQAMPVHQGQPEI